MKVFDAMKSGVAAMVTAATAKDKARAAVPENIRVLHASDLGKCPVMLWYSLQDGSTRGDRGYRRVLFLNDGFTHEEELRKLIQAGAPTLDVLGNVQVAPLVIEGTNIQVWGEADIVYKGTTKVVVESKAVYHDTFERYVNDPSTIPDYYFVQLAFYIMQEKADEGTLVLKDRERSEYFPDPWGDEAPAFMTLSAAQAKKIIDAKVEMVRGILVTPPQIPDSVLDQCRFCQHRSTCYASILTGRDINDPEPLVVTGKSDGLSRNLTEAVRLRREIDGELAVRKTARSNIDDDIVALLKENGVKKLVTDEGTVTIVYRDGNEKLTPTAKALIDSMKKDGTLEMVRGPGSTYPRYSKGVSDE